jgi:hypothetical protein
MAGKKKYWDMWSMLLLCVAGLLILYALFRYIRNRILDKQVKDETTKKTAQMSNETVDTNAIRVNLSKFIDSCAVSGADQNFAVILLGQSIHETSAQGADKLYHPFTSAVCLNNTNYFGMRHPIERTTTSQGDRNGYAYYASLEDSVKDVILWHKAKNNPVTGLNTDYDGIKTYVSDLKKHGYFTATLTEYMSGVWSGVKRIKDLMKAG